MQFIKGSDKSVRSGISNLWRRFGGDEAKKKRKRNYAERRKLQRAVIYIVPISNQCLSKYGTFITTRDETNADVALNCFPNYMTQTFLSIRTNYDFNKFVNLACQNLIFTIFLSCARGDNSTT
jgi:hypothetical protein